MKNLITTITFLSFIFWFTGCDESSILSPENDISIESLSKAGNDNPNTDPADANYFDLDGNLCYKNFPIPPEKGQEIGTPLELWMGVGNQDAGTKVGEITFNGNCVRIDLTKGEGVYDATAIHMDFADEYEDFHTNKPGNPVVGKFDYNYDTPEKLNGIRVAPSVYEICGIALSGFNLGAIHVDAVSGTGTPISSPEDFKNILPEGLITMSVENYKTPPPSPSYFKLHIGEDGGVLEGEYEGWCIDNDNTIDRLTEYSAYIYSSYEDLPDKFTGDNKINFPENLDKVNYLLNNFAAGDKITINCDGISVTDATITSGDIQRAIWYFLDDDITNPDALGPWDEARTNAIICYVEENGEGFEPDCGDYILFIAIPVDESGNLINQAVVGRIPMYCPGEGSGTAWADGKYGIGFTGNSWATYFGIGCPE